MACLNWNAYLTYILLLAATLTACTNPISAIPDFGLGSSDDSPLVQLHMLGWPRSETEDAQLQLLIDAFNQANPAVHVTLELSQNYEKRLRQVLSNDQLPDILYVDSFRFPTLATSGALMPLLAVETGNNSTNVSQLDDFYPVLRQTFTARGTPYCLPAEFRSLALFYNRTMFANAGLDGPVAEPNGNWQWADLETAAKELANVKNIYYADYGLSLDADMSRWLAFFYQAGGTIQNADEIAVNNLVPFRGPAAQTALDFYTSLLVEEYAIQPAMDRSGWPGEAFSNQRVAMVIEGNWLIPYLAQRTPDLDYGVAELPSGPSGKGTVLFSRCYAISSHSRYPNVAAILIDWLLHPENMAAITDWQSTMPSRISLQDAWLAQHPNLAPFMAGIDYGKPWQLPAGHENLLPDFNEGIQAIIDEEYSVQEVLENLD